MDREQYEEAQRRLAEVTRILKHEKISEEERARLEREGNRLARAVMSPWLPFGRGLRILMIAVAAIGLWGLSQGQHLFVLVWMLLPLFSPRIVGMCLNAITGFKNDERR